MKELAYKKNTVIFREGDSSDCMYDILGGRVGIYAGYGTPEEKLLTELKEGDFFGEMGMIEDKPRSATAVVLEKDTQLMTIDKEQLKGYLRVRPARVLQIMQHMSSRLRQLSDDYLAVCKTLDRYDKAAESDAKSTAALEKYAVEYLAQKNAKAEG